MLGLQCEIGEGTVVEGAVLWRRSKVNKGALIKNCILCFHSHVRERSHVLGNCVLADCVMVDAGSILTNGTKVWPNGCVEPNATQT